MEVKWLRLALEDLDGIFRYIAQNNEQAASHIISQIWHSGQLLGQHPNMGRAGRVAGTRELVIQESKYLIPYRVIDDEVQILRVLHGAMDWPKSF